MQPNAHALHNIVDRNVVKHKWDDQASDKSRISRSVWDVDGLSMEKVHTGTFKEILWLEKMSRESNHKEASYHNVIW